MERIFLGGTAFIVLAFFFTLFLILWAPPSSRGKAIDQTLQSFITITWGALGSIFMGWGIYDLYEERRKKIIDAREKEKESNG